MLQNDCDVPIALECGAEPWHVAPGEMRALPLEHTAKGSEAALWSMRLRPSSVSSTHAYAYASLRPLDLTRGMLSCLTSDSGHAGKGVVEPWLCGAALEYPPMLSEARGDFVRTHSSQKQLARE